LLYAKCIAGICVRKICMQVKEIPFNQKKSSIYQYLQCGKAAFLPPVEMVNVNKTVDNG
jgi:hypothetical protein